MVRFQKLTRNLFLTLHGHNVHRQQRQLSKFLMYQCFSIVFFNSAGSDVLQKETTTLPLGHPICRI